jgi:hypothetical protein
LQQLLDEQRVSLCRLENLSALEITQLPLAELVIEESISRRVIQRTQHERRNMGAPSTPGRTHLEQLGPGQADQQDRAPTPVNEVLDEVQQRCIGPVNIVDDQEERGPDRQSLEHPPERPRHLLADAFR